MYLYMEQMYLLLGSYLGLANSTCKYADLVFSGKFLPSYSLPSLM